MTQHPGVREYREQLQDRIQAERDAPQPVPVARLGVFAAGEHWLVRLDEAQEVLAVGSIAPVPLTQPWFRGLVNVRGSLYSVVDFGHFVSGRATEIGVDARLIVLADRFHLGAALLVERTLGLRTGPGLEPRADAAPHPRGWTGGRWRDGEGRDWHEVSIGELAQDPALLAAGR